VIGRRTWVLHLGGALALVAYAIFQGDATGDNALMWLGGGALAVIWLALATVGRPARVWTLVPLAGLGAWFALSITWSSMPDRSWAYADRALVYLLFVAVGLWLAPRTRELAIGLCALLAATAVWALAGKVLPVLPSSTPGVRLNAPVGLWNQLALLGDFALVLALWVAAHRRVTGSLLAYLWIVALVLTVSRGGIAIGVLAVLAWMALSGGALDALMTVVAAGIPAAAVAGVAFALPAITSTSVASNASQWHQGLVFGGLLLAGAAACAALTRLPRPEVTATRRRGALAVGAIAALALVAGVALKAQSLWDRFTSSAEVGNSSQRLASLGSNFRWAWWTRAWHVFTLHPLQGTGAGTFSLTDLLYSSTDLDTTIEPHNLPLQLLAETGLVGFMLLALSVGALLGSAGKRRGHELALWFVVVVFLVHALIDVDWDFVAVCAPAFLVAGALAGRPLPPRTVSPSALVLSAGAALMLFTCLLLPWLGNRWENEAGLESPAHAIATARAAHSVDPLLVQPLQTEAENQPHTLAGRRAALALYRQTTHMQPQNPYTWLDLGLFEFYLRCPVLAYPALETYTNLDSHADDLYGGDQKLKALAYIDSGKADPAFCAAYQG
jgi:hypothetical protein